MKETSQSTAKSKANGLLNGSPLRNDYLAGIGDSSAMADFRERGSWGRKLFGRCRVLPVSLMAAVRSQRLSENFPIRQGQCKDLLPENRIYQGFCANFADAILCACCTKQLKISVRIPPLTMKNENQNRERIKAVALWPN
jgi:hypothetical protein